MSSTRKLWSQKSEGFEDIDDYDFPDQTPQQPPLQQPPVQQPPTQQPPAQQTPVQQPLPSHHEDKQQVDNPQQEANQDDEISYLQSPAIKGEEFHPFQPDLSVQVMASLAKAIMLTEELRRCDPPSLSFKWAKTKERDTFDSSDIKKLNNFILLCNLYFQQNSAYSNDAAKINFALSHLRSIASVSRSGPVWFFSIFWTRLGLVRSSEISFWEKTKPVWGKPVYIGPVLNICQLWTG